MSKTRFPSSGTRGSRSTAKFAGFVPRCGQLRFRAPRRVWPAFEVGHELLLSRVCSLPIVETLEQSALSATDPDEDHVALATFRARRQNSGRVRGRDKACRRISLGRKDPVRRRNRSSAFAQIHRGSKSTKSSIPTVFGFKTAALPGYLVECRAVVRDVPSGEGRRLPGGGGNGRNPVGVESTTVVERAARTESTATYERADPVESTEEWARNCLIRACVGFSEGRALPPGS